MYIYTMMLDPSANGIKQRSIRSRGDVAIDFMLIQGSRNQHFGKHSKQ